MLISVSLNPSIDRYIEIENITLGETNRVLRAHAYPGGKGINVALIAARFGTTKALGFMPENDREFFESALAKGNVEAHFVSTPGGARVNLKALDTISRVITEFNEKGAPVPPDAMSALESSIAEHDSPDAFFMFSGSLPNGCSGDAYARLIRPLKGRAALDCAGVSLKAGLESKPFLIKPNQAELSELLGRRITDEREALSGALEALELGAGICCVSLGAKGSLITDGKQAFRAYSRAIDVRSTVGAGDALLAGLCAGFAQGYALNAALLQGAACANAAVMSQGTTFEHELKPELVTIEELDL